MTYQHFQKHITLTSETGETWQEGGIVRIRFDDEYEFYRVLIFQPDLDGLGEVFAECRLIEGSEAEQLKKYDSQARNARRIVDKANDRNCRIWYKMVGPYIDTCIVLVPSAILQPDVKVTIKAFADAYESASTCRLEEVSGSRFFYSRQLWPGLVFEPTNAGELNAYLFEADAYEEILHFLERQLDTDDLGWRQADHISGIHYVSEDTDQLGSDGPIVMPAAVFADDKKTSPPDWLPLHCLWYRSNVIDGGTIEEYKKRLAGSGLSIPWEQTARFEGSQKRYTLTFRPVADENGCCVLCDS